MGERIAAAGFGYKGSFACMNSPIEKFVGNYIVDSKMIARDISRMRYPAEFLPRFVQCFQQAATNTLSDCRATLEDDLEGEPTLLGLDRVNRLKFTQDLKDWLEYDDMPSRRQFGKYILDDNPEWGLFRFDLTFPDDFPAAHHLQQKIVIGVIARYDLDGGEDQRKFAVNQSRQLALRGEIWMEPSGRRGWKNPTVKYYSPPLRDDRNDRERNLKPAPRIGRELDDDMVQSGIEAARRGNMPSHEQWSDLSFMAGYVLAGENSNAFGHMTTGQVHLAYSDALSEAMRLQVPDPHSLAADACRHFASTRCAAALEKVIAES